MADKSLHVLVSGLVQGVFFRASTREMARSLDLKGWVRNLPDGKVEAFFEGDEASLARALDWCRRGPPGSRPEGVEADWQEFRGEHSEFRIVY